jgi:hypothetical protein
MSEDQTPQQPQRAEPLTPPPPGVIDYQQPLSSTAVRWTTVWKGGPTTEANLLVTKLQAAGMHARVDMENMGTLGMGASVLYGTKVQVLAQDEADARAIIDDIEATRARRVEAQSVRCPRCNAGNPKRTLHPIRWAGIATLVGFIAALAMEEWLREHDVSIIWVLLLLPIGIAMLIWGVTPRWLCRSCGNRWAAKEPEPLEEEEDADEDDDADDEPEDDDDDEGPEGGATSSSSSPTSR